MLTYNIITYKVDMLATQLKIVTGYFDKIRVLDSNLKSNRIKQVVSRFKDVEYYEKEFDNPVKQIQYILSKAELNEWFMFASYDEIPSVQLLENLYNEIDACIESGSNSIFFPFISVNEYIQTSEITEKIKQTIAWKDIKVAEEFGMKDKYPWPWNTVRLFQNDGKVRIESSVHEIVSGRKGAYVSTYPILHYKRYNGFILSALWQSVCDEQSKVPKDITDELLKCIKESGIQRNADSIYEHLKSGKISQSLKDWMWKNKNGLAYVRAWFIAYYFEFHPEELPEDFWDGNLLGEWRNHVLGGSQKSDVMHSRLHPLMKRKLLKRGIKELDKGVSL